MSQLTVIGKKARKYKVENHNLQLTYEQIRVMVANGLSILDNSNDIYWETLNAA